jgi:hypothetical protein
MCRKGIRINIPEPYIGYYYGNVSEHGDVSRCPRKSYLFFLTILMSLRWYCIPVEEISKIACYIQGRG